MSKNDEFQELIAMIDADNTVLAIRHASGINVVVPKAKTAKRSARRPVTTIWDEGEVAKRALELHDLERAANAARSHAFDRADDYKEIKGLVRVDLHDEGFQKYTAATWSAYLDAKHAVKLARARLLTACRNCQRHTVPHMKIKFPRMSKRTERRLFGE